MPNFNQLILEDAAAKLQPLLDRIAFVGGATLTLLITDPGAPHPRATIDVDIIAEISTHMEYFDFSQRLRAIGFAEDASPEAPNCRWRHGELILDVMPLDPSILGFSNRWYPEALETAQKVRLSSGAYIRSITAPYFLATKMEAFRGRGRGDFYASRDLEDFISLIDGRKSILAEIASAPTGTREYLSAAAGELLSQSRFLDALPGFLLPEEASQQRLPEILGKLRQIARH